MKNYHLLRTRIHMIGGRKNQLFTVQQHSGLLQLKHSVMNYLVQLKKRNSHLHGVKHVFTIWFVTVGIGVFPVNVCGAFRFQYFMRKMVNQLLQMKRLHMFQNYSVKHGSNIWFEREAVDLLPEGFTHEGQPEWNIYERNGYYGRLV